MKLRLASLRASWQSNKFINPIQDGAVLPILHINGYKISNPTLYSLMSDEELQKYFEGLGWKPIFVSQYESGNKIYEDFLKSLDEGINDIWKVQKSWREDNSKHKPIWPLIILRSKKGWTGPQFCKNSQLEDNCLSHGIPLQKVKSDEQEFETLKQWLEQYKVGDFFEENGQLIKSINEFLPINSKKLGQNSYGFGPLHRTSLLLPNLSELEDKLDKGQACNSMIKTGEYLRDLYNLNKNNFRLFSPDEASSNKLDKVFEATCKTMIWPIREVDTNIECDGRVMEILSEHVLMEWMTGYNMTGRHGVLVSYEAFLSIIVSQIDQYIKFLKKSESIPWRQGLPSLNLISTSTAWIQEHNGFSHQNPSLISTLLSTQSDFVSVYFPADSNIMLATLEDSFSRKDSLNLITASKRDTPCWLDIKEAREHVQKVFLFGNLLVLMMELIQIL
ncbi:MAG: hypothetical protein HC932_06070 [Thermales bacterium]|nr:hypothetical protein [Thermales bacterium]